MIVLSVPPLDLLPYFQDPDLKKQWGDASKSFNKLLEKDSILLNQHHSALELDIIHVHTLLRDIVQNPASFGFVNAKDSYWDACQGQCKDKMDSYVWWDKTQLTGGAHRAIANSILLSGSLEPSSFLDENVDVEALLAKKDSIYRSPIYKPKANTGLIEKTKRTGNLSALSGIIGNRNQGRGRFIPLRNIETEA
ncbi:hypothetical protein J3Q64DRAFT_1642158 [Phycomyces blakesleeanus]|uniref:Uncharacterized protein n=1 Tax=Phycomyces blakesleeanus TaxID=4837 RepID=A0ABR3AX08_PHYBL